MGLRNAWRWLGLSVLLVLCLSVRADGQGAGRYQWYDNARFNGAFWVTDPLFGAKCDGVTDDSAAITAAVAAAGNGGVVVFPCATCAINSPIQVTTSTRWSSPWGGITAPIQTPIILAGASMNAMVTVHTTQLITSSGWTPARFDGLSFEATLAANYAVELIGASQTQFNNCQFKHALLDGVHVASHRLPLTLSSVTATVPGGSPAGVTVTQPDPGYAAVAALPVPFHVVLKINSTGALNAGNYVTSFDNGVTFQTATELVSSHSSIVLASGAVYNYPIGVQAVFPAGTYHAGDTYAFTVTAQTEDSSDPFAINVENHFDDDWFDGNGNVFATAGLLGNYAAPLQSTSIGGTATTTNGSQVVTITGASPLTTSAREGDLILLNGSIFPLLGAIDDKTYLIQHGSEPTFTASGLDYAVGVGAGYWEDAGSENIRNTFDYGTARYNPTNFRFGGGQSSETNQVRTELYGLAGYSFGSASQNMQGVLMLHPHLEAGYANSTGAYFSAAVQYGSVFEPPELFTAQGPGHVGVTFGGSFYSYPNGTGLQSLVAMANERLIETSITISSAGQQLPAPALVPPATATSRYLLNAGSSPIVMTGTPVILGSPVNGQKLELLNNGASWITFSTNAETSSGINLEAFTITIGPGQEVKLVSRNSQWDQVSPVMAQYFTAIGGQGAFVPPPVQTTTNAVTPILKVNCVNPSSNAGATIHGDLMAETGSPGGTSTCTIYDVQVSWDIACNLLQFSVGNIVGTGGAGCPFGWAWGPDASGTSPYTHFNVQGDNAHTVNWKWVGKHLSPP